MSGSTDGSVTTKTGSNPSNSANAVPQWAGDSVLIPTADDGTAQTINKTATP